MQGGVLAAEAYAVHCEYLASKRELYDPRVANRILHGREQSAAEYLELIHARDALQRRVDERLAEYDAVLLPTVAIIAPLLQELQSDEAYLRINQLVLRNTAVANFLDRCAVSVPIQEPGEAPVGLMLIGANGDDRRLLAIAAAVEPLVCPPRHLSVGVRERSP